MFIELYLLQTYFAEQFSSIYEDDLIDRFGYEPVQKAIKSGYLEHRRIPCGTGKKRCVCRLSDKGIKLAYSMMA